LACATSATVPEGSGSTKGALSLSAYPCLSKGNDSYVYKVGERVAKEYQKLSFDEVARYVRLQNAAVGAVAELGYTAEFRMQDLSCELRVVEAVPVHELTISSSGRPLTFSRFVPEPNVEKLMWRPERYREWAVRELPDRRLRAFADDLNLFFWNEYPTRVRDEIHYHLAMLSHRLDALLGVSGLYISKYNAKLRPHGERPGLEMIVTDIALYIDRLRYDAA
jgi:hypothetical protein